MTGGAARTFHRTLATRLLSLATFLVFAAAAATRAAALEFGPGFWVVLLIAAAGAAGTVGAWGDRITLDAEGVEMRNVLLERIGLRGRRVAWTDITAVREHRRLRAGGEPGPVRAIFLITTSGRRVVLDSLQDFDTLRQDVARRIPRS